LSLAISTSHGAAFNWISRIRAVQEPMSNFAGNEKEWVRPNYATLKS